MVDDRTNQVGSEGERLLTAVERLVCDVDELVTHVEALREELVAEAGVGEEARRRAVAGRIIASYSTRSAVAGAVTALPAIVPVGGTMVAVLGGSLFDMAFMLKHEVEMALCLAYLYGHDIRDERGRWLGYVLASVGTYEAKSGRNYFVDLAEAELEAVTRYTPRQMAKMIMSIMSRIALLAASRSFVKAVPVVGVVVGASANKVMTGSVGWKCVDALARLEATNGEGGGAVVDASVV